MKAPTKFDCLRNRLESAAFLMAGGAAREAHAEIVQGLVLLAEIESAYLKQSSPEAPSDTGQEINKVKRRLKLWAKRPDQINARILTAYLKLERSSASSTVTEADLKNELRDEVTFESNLAQMKTVADKNHGKVFETYGDRVTLWPPVVPAIREFEKAIFGNT